MADGKQIALKSLFKTALNNFKVILGVVLLSSLLSSLAEVYNWSSSDALFTETMMPSDAFIEALSSIAVMSIFLSIGIGLFIFGLIDFIGTSTMKKKYVKGSKKISLSELKKDIEASKEFDFEKRSPDDLNIPLIDPSNDKPVSLRIPVGAGAGHTLFLGVSGAGKSQVIEAEIDEIISVGNKLIIVDPGGRYYEKYGRADDVILSLYDKRSSLIDFWSEDSTPDEIATSIIEEKENLSGGAEFFTLSPRAVFAGLMDASSNTQELYSHLKSMDTGKIKKLLQEVDSLGAGVLGAKETAGNIMASLAVKMNWIKHINYWPLKMGQREPFLVSKWVRDDSDDRIVFLTARERDWEFAKHIIRVWFELASNSIFGRGYEDGFKRIIAVCDEVSTIGRIATLPKIIDKGRKDGFHLKVGLQDVAQFQSKYGVNEAKNIINGFQNKYMFRGTGTDLLALMEQSCGEGHWLSKVEQIDSRGEKSLQSIVEKIPPFSKDDFLNMSGLNFVIKLSTMNPSQARIAHVDRPSINVADMSEVPKAQRPPKSPSPSRSSVPKSDPKQEGKDRSRDDEPKAPTDDISVWDD